MNGYDQHNYRGDYGRDYENRNRRRDNDDERNLSNYLSRYQEGGNYYGMPNNDYEYRNVRVSREADYGRNSSGPVGGYGSSSYHDDQESRGGRDSYRDSGRSSGQYNDNYSSGSRKGNSNNESDHYRYGDPNPYMGNDRNGGYERTRGTGWRSESDDRHRGNDNYSRQDNSYQYSGSGRRYSDFGRDERKGQDEQLTDIHTDRGEHRRRRSDNNYDNQQNRRSDRDDNYATGSYSSNRAYLSEQGRDRDENMFDHTSDDYPNRSPRGYGRRSGPDYSARSPIGSDQHRSADRG